jgi:hypothetical protein
VRFKDGWAFITAGKVRTRVASVEGLSLKPERATLVAKIEEGRDFRAAVKAAGVTVAANDTANFAFSTLHIKQGERTLVVESADGYGLMRTEQPCGHIGKAKGDRLNVCLMGTQVAALVRATLADGPTLLGVAGTRLHVETAGATLQLATGSGMFPDTATMLPERALLHTAALGREDLMAAVRRAQHFGPDQPVEFEWAKGRVTVRSKQGPGVTGDYEEDLAQAGVDKTRCKWSVAPKRLLSALAEIGDVLVTVSFNGSQDRLLFTGSEDEGVRFKYVTMPFRSGDDPGLPTDSE